MKKVTYKIEQFKSMTIEVESDEQVQKNRRVEPGL